MYAGANMGHPTDPPTRPIPFELWYYIDSFGIGSCSALALLVLGVFADYAHHSSAVDDFALVTDLFYGCPYLHLLLTFLYL